MNKSQSALPRRIARVAAALLLGAGTAVHAQGTTEPVSAQLATMAQELVQQAANSAHGGKLRVQVQVGQADPRLRLAPCRRVEPFLPPGHRPIGRTRVGLRCVDGAVAWSITLPVQVSVFAPGVVATEPLAMGTRLTLAHLTVAEIDWGASSERAFDDVSALLGRELSRPLAAGAALRATDLRQKQWFAAGETVQVTARGQGFAIATDAEALTPGLEGQPVRVRTSAGRILSGRAVADRQVEVLL